MLAQGGCGPWESVLQKLTGCLPLEEPQHSKTCAITEGVDRGLVLIPTSRGSHHQFNSQFRACGLLLSPALT